MPGVVEGEYGSILLSFFFALRDFCSASAGSCSSVGDEGLDDPTGLRRSCFSSHLTLGRGALLAEVTAACVS